jgi:hypothetical protein
MLTGKMFNRPVNEIPNRPDKFLYELWSMAARRTPKMARLEGGGRS